LAFPFHQQISGSQEGEEAIAPDPQAFLLELRAQADQ
jgi:hypothetical protein